MMIPLRQQAIHVAAKAVAAANNPAAMMVPVLYRSLLTDLAALLVDMASAIDNKEKKNDEQHG